MKELMSVRPPGESFNEACIAIGRELKGAGLRPSRIITHGITQPDGSQIYHVFIKGE